MEYCYPKILCLVCQTQERGTLLSYRPKLVQRVRRDGRDDGDGCFGGVIFTVATVATVAPEITRLLRSARRRSPYR